MKTTVLVFTEGDFDGAKRFDSAAEAVAYHHGLIEGAGKYGGDGLTAYVMPGDLASMRQNEDVASVAAAIAEWPDAMRHGCAF